MKTKKYMLTLFAIFMMVTISAVVKAQSTRVYTKGHVFALSMIKTNPGMTDDYIATLKNTVKAMDDEGMKEGLLLSYKIFIGGSANDNDWDILILEEYTDMNTMANNDDKWDAIQQKMVGNDAAMKTIMTNRVPLRTIYGDKIMQEVIFK